MRIAVSAVDRHTEVEEELRSVETKLEVKTSVLEYSKSKAAHYMAMSERLRVELRDLKVLKSELEKRLRLMDHQ